MNDKKVISVRIPYNHSLYTLLYGTKMVKLWLGDANLLEWMKTTVPLGDQCKHILHLHPFHDILLRRCKGTVLRPICYELYFTIFRFNFRLLTRWLMFIEDGSPPSNSFRSVLVYCERFLWFFTPFYGSLLDLFFKLFDEVKINVIFVITYEYKDNIKNNNILITTIVGRDKFPSSPKEGISVIQGRVIHITL